MSLQDSFIDSNPLVGPVLLTSRQVCANIDFCWLELLPAINLSHKTDRRILKVCLFCLFFTFFPSLQGINWIYREKKWLKRSASKVSTIIPFAWDQKTPITQNSNTVSFLLYCSRNSFDWRVSGKCFNYQ